MITIDKTQLAKIKEKGKDFWPNPDAEGAILELMDAKTKIEETLTEIKETVMEKCTKQFGENFKQLKGDSVTISSQSGRRTLAMTGDDGIPFTFQERKVDPKLVDKYIKENDGKMPPGIEATVGKSFLVIRRG